MTLPSNLLRCLFGPALIGAGCWLQAAEMRVRAPVIEVEPLSAPAAEVEYCDARPAAGAGLAELMAWDLGLNCRTEQLDSGITGYRVFYRRDDRVYSRVMAYDPGPTIPLKVRLD